MQPADFKKHGIPTPFAAPSWEPRFAVDAFDDLEALVPLALRLHVRSSHAAWAYKEGAAVFRGYQLGDNQIIVAAHLSRFPRKPHGEIMQTLFEDVTLEAASEGILHWLDNAAEPPPKPWFDGSEELGLQLYHVPYGQPGPYGYMVAESKWFEIHK